MKDKSNLLVEKEINGGRYNSMFEVKLTPQAERA